jgi:glycosyltransferase involved in cell wall biosynthesis
MPAVSVVIPHYRGMRTLPATLASVLRQSQRDIDVIIVDDGSDDQTREALKALAATDPRVRAVFQTNGGVSIARNTGIQLATSPTIAFMDADDQWPAHHLEVHLARLDANSALGVSFSLAVLVDAAGQVVGQTRPKLLDLTAADLLFANATTTTSSWVVRRNVFDVVGMFDGALRHAEDQEWLVRAALAGVQIEGTDQSVIAYRTAVGGLASDIQRMSEGIDAMLRAVRSHAPAFADQHEREARARADQYLARHALRLGLSRRLVFQSLYRAVKARPLLALREPRRTLGVGLAALAPFKSLRG